MTFTPVPEPRRGQRKHLTLEEWRRVMHAAKHAGLQEHALLRVLYETGMRASEPGGLVLDHLKRLESNQLYVPRGKGSVTGWQTISRDLADLLWKWTCRVYNCADLSPRVVGEKYGHMPVFPGQRNLGRATSISRKQVWRICKELMGAADVPDEVAYPHAIKHSRVQHLFEEAEKQGMPAEAALKTVAAIVGHRSAQTSWEHYVAQTGRGKKVADEALRKAMEE